MAEENRCRKDKQKIDFIIEAERITVASEAKSKERVTKTS